MMLRYSEKIAEKENAHAIITGDSLGQVASQTLQNMFVIDEVVSLPILRPLIGYDKEDIVKISKKIGTYPFSIIPSSSCQAVPSKPATKARLDQIRAEENKIDIDALVRHGINNAQRVTL
jgi:thiamine biosynthesis protein ThiI